MGAPGGVVRAQAAPAAISSHVLVVFSPPSGPDGEEDATSLLMCSLGRADVSACSDGEDAAEAATEDGRQRFRLLSALCQTGLSSSDSAKLSCWSLKMYLRTVGRRNMLFRRSRSRKRLRNSSNFCKSSPPGSSSPSSTQSNNRFCHCFSSFFVGPPPPVELRNRRRNETRYTFSFSGSPTATTSKIGHRSDNAENRNYGLGILYLPIFHLRTPRT